MGLFALLVYLDARGPRDQEEYPQPYPVDINGKQMALLFVSYTSKMETSVLPKMRSDE